MAYNPNFDQIGNAFVQHYYSKFDVGDASVRNVGLEGLYDPENSFLTFEGNQVKGKQNLPFRSIQHAITKTDCQPLSDGSVFVTVFGQLKTDDDPINSFNHAFVLKPNPAGSFYIANEIFRLVLHDL